MDATVNAINWFEIPASDIARAQKFYETIFSVEMMNMDMPEMGMKSAAFPYDPTSGKSSGSIAQSPMHKPNKEGTIIYLNANPSIDAVVSKVESAGGSIVMPKSQISPEIGFMAFITDTEGNKIGLHANG